MIIGFSGKKQSGKDTSCNFCLGTFMWSERIIDGEYLINSRGQLVITDLFGDTKSHGIFDSKSRDPGMIQFLDEHVNNLCKIYSFAGVLKREVCIGVLGLSEQAVYGTDEEKAEPTHLRWEDMPSVVTNQDTFPAHKNWDPVVITWADKYQKELIFHSPGLMSGRDVMQYVGTDIFRKMYGDVWVHATLEKIKTDNPKYALISDVRFPNEVHGVQKAGGMVIRLLKDTKLDTHESESALDNYLAFDAVLDNRELSIPQQNAEIMKILSTAGAPLKV